MAEDRIYAAETAARLLGELRPFTDAMEADYIAQAVSGDRVSDAGRNAIMEALRRVETIRDLRSRLEMDIQAGKTAVKNQERRTV